MKRRINKGQPLTELVKGSLDYTSAMIRAAFRAQFRTEDRYWDWYIVETFADHVIVQDHNLPPDEFCKVTYQRSGTGYLFAARDAWQVVELAYQSQTANERRKMLAGEVGRGRGGAAQFVESRALELRLEEKTEGKPRRITARGMTAGIINNNNRRYAADVLQAAVDEANAKMARGELQLLAEDNHPSDKLGVPSVLANLILWHSITFEENEVRLSGTIIETTDGKNLITILDAGVRPRLSQRAYGFAERVKENGRVFDDIVELHLTGYDLVMTPGDPTAGVITVESHHPHKETITMDELDLETLRTQYPDLVAKIEAEHDARKKAQLEESLRAKQAEDERNRRVIAEANAQIRQQLGLSESDDLQEALNRQALELRRLQEAEQQRQVGTYIDSQVAEIKYADALKPQFVESVRTAAPKTIDEAKTVIATKRKEYDAIQASIELALRGRGGVQVLGPVLEGARGVPEYARASFALNESLIRSGHATQRNLAQPKNINELFAVEYLKRFDAAYKRHLVAEARSYEEAEQASDLNLPYSVARAVMAEALPQLVAISVFDVQMVDNAPTTNIFFEKYVGETGATGTVTNEAVTASNPLAQWVSLNNKRLIPGTVVLTNSAGTTTYTEGSDYVVDYANGRVMALATITAGQSLLIDYQYDAIRKGEMVGIERGKQQLSFVSIAMAADRLATEISTEAIVFSRAALGYDAVNRTLAGLVAQINRKIDGGLFYLALSAALRVANNSGGTWTAASDSLDDLVAKIGVAKVKVANRFYEPTAVIMSITNSDRLSNSESFTAAGKRPDMDLTSAGYVGRVKGLPVFQTPNFTDAYIPVVNREVVAHRIGQPMHFEGPFPAYDSNGKLMAAKQYYAEEMNASETPVPEKASSVKVA